LRLPTAVWLGSSNGQVKAGSANAEGNSQADYAGSIPVTRSRRTAEHDGIAR
jgi:hypothetical protein